MTCFQNFPSPLKPSCRIVISHLQLSLSLMKMHLGSGLDTIYLVSVATSSVIMAQSLFNEWYPEFPPSHLFLVPWVFSVFCSNTLEEWPLSSLVLASYFCYSTSPDFPLHLFHSPQAHPLLSPLYSLALSVLCPAAYFLFSFPPV